MKIQTHTDEAGETVVTVTIDNERTGTAACETMTLGEWSKLIANPTVV